MQNYKLLEKQMEEISQLNNIMNLLSWDIAVNMPIGSVESRASEISLLNSIIHSKLKSPKLTELINAANAEIKQLDNWQIANLRETKKKVEYSNCISNDLQKRYIIATTKSELVWREARKENDFNKLKAYLKEVINCVQEIAEAKSTLLNCSKYDALVDEYDPSRNTKDLKQTFAVLRALLPDLIKQIVEKQKVEKVLPVGEILVEEQKLISRKIMKIMGFDFSRGRLDESTHPFCGGTTFDVRLTNRYSKNDFISGVMGIIHETGHALYEQNLPTNYKNQPVGKANGMAIHESQSLFMEMQVGRSRQFCEFLSKLLCDELRLKGKEYSRDNLYKLITRVKPSFIRVDADEVTYPLHIIFRFEIEELLVNKKLDLDDLPDFWNQKMQEYLGILPSTDSNGCLQDIHWSSGWFGYFAAYTNGAVIASQLMRALKESEVNIDAEIANGNFEIINKFLNDRIWKYGSLKYCNDLINEVTGDRGVNPETFLQYLKQKYLS